MITLVCNDFVLKGKVRSSVKTNKTNPTKHDINTEHRMKLPHAHIQREVTIYI